MVAMRLLTLLALLGAASAAIKQSTAACPSGSAFDAASLQCTKCESGETEAAASSPSGRSLVCECNRCGEPLPPATRWPRDALGAHHPPRQLWRAQLALPARCAPAIDRLALL